MAKNTITVKLLGENKDLKKALDDSEGHVSKWAGKFTKILAGGAAAGALAIGAGLAASVGQAVDLGESINAVEVTFGDAAEGIKKLGEEAATAVGLSNSEFNGLAVQFSSFAKTVSGPGGDVVSTMDDLTTRVADFASVMNMDVNDAAAAFQSGLAGETEPLKKFGIDLSAAAIEAYALANGITDGSTQMTEAQKVQARYGLLMQETAKTQGDFTNTSDSLANRQRVLSARMKDLGAKIGSALLPVLTDLADIIATKVVPWIEDNLPKAIDVAKDALSQIVEVGREVVEFFQNNQPALIGLLAILAAGFLAWAASAAAAAAATLAAAAPIIAVVAAIGLVVAALVWAYQNWGWFRDAVDATVSFLVNTAWPFIQTVATGIADAFGAMVGFVQTHWGTIQSIIDTVINAIKTIVETVVGVIRGIWQTWGDELVEIITTTWDTIKGIVDSVINVIKGIIETVTSLIKGDWDGVWNGIKDILSGVWDGMKTIVSGAIEIIKSTISGAWDSVKTTAETTWGLIKTTISGAIDEVVGFVTGLPDRLVEGLEALKTAGASIGGAILDGIGDGISGAVGFFSDLASAVKSGIIGAANSVIDKVNDALEFTISGPFGVSITLNPPDIPHIPKFHTGGIVPGPSGAEVPIMAQAGEGVFTEEQMAAMGRGGGITVVVEGGTFGPTEAQMQQIGRVLDEWEQRRRMAA